MFIFPHMSEPLFSIITVTYNAAETLRPTMVSVASQSCRDYEHLVIDGASTDDTAIVARELGTELTVFTSEPDQGIYDAMNRGLDRARGQYLIFLNAGDSFHTHHTLEDIAQAIRHNDFPGIVYGQTELVDNQRRYIGPRHLTAPATLTLASFADGMVVCHQAMAVLKKVTGLYSMKYRFSSDYDWVIRCLQRSRHNVYIDEVIVDYLYEGTTTRNHRASLRERFKIMCHYYGTIPTVARHAKFAIRHLLRRLTTGSQQ